MREEKQAVRDFYDSFGWKKTPDGYYQDTVTFGDVRPIGYLLALTAHQRVKAALPASGTYFLDAGCGPIPYPWYVEYSEGYRWRVCADLSKTALREARTTLGSRGLYVVADMGWLPFRAGVFDGALAAHSLYHVPKDEQEQAVRELYRTLAPKGRCVVVYIRPSSPLTRLAQSFDVLRKILARILRGRALARNTRPHSTSDTAAGKRPPTPYLYYYAYDYPWFHSTFSDLPLEIRPWMAFDTISVGALIPDNGFGRWLIRMESWLEDRFPAAAVRWGRYPMIMLRKEESAQCHSRRQTKQ